MAEGRVPWSVWALGLPGVACLLLGMGLLAGVGSGFHPLLQASGAELVLIVSGVALLGTAGFPLVLARLADKDEAA
ncbi:hypothetical protein [Zoogloea sp.]|uniref:hypothetical protein n=1 Tax=Zoogloea sp. TaxID=49181 RepID=UPI00262737A1|nr:hypothetical protein [Zoogloea sp.]MDD3352248.1 hypothetical protein [Zoogloea sp.]